MLIKPIKIHSRIVEAMATYSQDTQLKLLGREMFRLYTERGFPPDMFLDRLNKHLTLDLLAKIFIISEYHSTFLEHRRRSGIGEARLRIIRRRNRRDLERFVITGELGIY